jgi:FMN phosphatase YigB (HAD superfamily)
MRIIFDFDHTLFDTPRLKRAVEGVFVKHGVSRELFCKTMEESKGEGRDWKPERQFEILEARGTGNVKNIQRDFEDILGHGEIFLYNDTLPFLERARQAHFLALLSYGEDSFQNAKINGCGHVREYFDRVVITQNLYKDKEAAELAGKGSALFVEDNPIALLKTKQYAPHIVTVRMKRGEGRYENEESHGGVDYEVKSLSEVESIIKNHQP